MRGPGRIRAASASTAPEIVGMGTPSEAAREAALTGGGPDRDYPAAMPAYAELAPPPGLEAQVACVWVGDGGAVRVLPDACADIVFTGGRLVVAGPATLPDLAPATPGQDRYGVRFRVGLAGGALGLPASELLDQVVPLAEIWGTDGRRLEDRVAAAEQAARDADRRRRRARRRGARRCRPRRGRVGCGGVRRAWSGWRGRAP